MSSRPWKIPVVKLLLHCEYVLAYDLTFTTAWVTHNMPFVQYLSTTTLSEFAWKCQMYRNLLNTKTPLESAPSATILFGLCLWRIKVTMMHLGCLEARGRDGRER